jgi:5-methylcytosine-specific restriction endonuclease McrA
MRIYNTTAWQHIRPLVLERDGYRCHWCGRYANQVDHVKPLAHGGSAFNPANLVAACQPCNATRGAQTRRLLTPAPGLTRPVRNLTRQSRIGADRVRFGAIRG